MEIRRYADLAGTVLATPPRLGPVRLVAVDGPSGAGKTCFAERLAGALDRRGVPAPVVHTDALLDGWDDQITFWPRLEEWVLKPLSRATLAPYAGTTGTSWAGRPAGTPYPWSAW